MIFWPKKCDECGYCNVRIDMKPTRGGDLHMTLTCPRGQNPCWEGQQPVGTGYFLVWLATEWTGLRGRATEIMDKIRSAMVTNMDLVPPTQTLVKYRPELSYVFAPADSDKVLDAALRSSKSWPEIKGALNRIRDKVVEEGYPRVITQQVYEPNDLDRLREEAAVLGRCYDCDNVKKLGQECEVHDEPPTALSECCCCYCDSEPHAHDGECCPGWGHYNFDYVGIGVSDIEGCGTCDKMGDDEALVLHDQTCTKCRVLTPAELKDLGATPTSRGELNSNYLRILINPSEEYPHP